jgi:hypothetical protein
MLVYSEELKLLILFKNTILPGNRLRNLWSFIPSLRTSQFKYSIDKEGRKTLIRPTKYKVDKNVLLRLSKVDKAGHTVSPFEYRYLGPYQIHKILSKGPYVLKTIPQSVKDKIKYFRKPVNWSYLHRYLKEEEEVCEMMDWDERKFAGGREEKFAGWRERGRWGRVAIEETFARKFDWLFVFS